MPKNDTGTGSKRIAKCAVLCALMIVSCLVTIPLGPVPFTLQTAVIITIVLLCDVKETALTTGTYVLMGTIGLPVFSGMTSGLIRASTGYLIGFIVGGVVASWLRGFITRKTGKSLLADIVATVVYIVIDDALGWAWYVWYGAVGWGAAFGVMVAPFLLPDCAKAVIAIIVAREVRKRVPSIAS